MAKKTFDTLTQEFQLDINKAVYNMTLARTEDEVTEANTNCHKIISKYARDMKQFINNITLQVITDSAKMQKLLQDRFNLDPDKAELTFCINRNTVKWTLQLYAGEKFTYVSKKDNGVDLDNFYEWCRYIFS